MRGMVSLCWMYNTFEFIEVWLAQGYWVVEGVTPGHYSPEQATRLRVHSKNNSPDDLCGLRADPDSVRAALGAITLLSRGLVNQAKQGQTDYDMEGPPGMRDTRAGGELDCDKDRCSLTWAGCCRSKLECAVWECIVTVASLGGSGVWFKRHKEREDAVE
ncbi:hypothetical protein Tco_1473703 [Tanacetum coccineum]